MASIGEPFLVSSYAHSNRKLATKSKIFVTHNNHRSAPDGYITITAHGDGIHILDLSSLHSVMSYSLGPSTTFSCPAISCFTSESHCTTYAVVESSPDLEQPDFSGRTVWLWKQSLQSPSGSKKDRISITVPARISSLYDLDAPCLLLVSQEGDLILTDLDVQIKHHRPGTKRAVLESFLFRGECAFAPDTVSPGCSVLVLVSRDADGKETELEVFVICTDEGAEVRSLNSNNLRMNVEAGSITSITCSPSGHLTILTQSGSWHHYYLYHSSTFLGLTKLNPPIHLSPSTVPPERTKALALTSSHVLLCTLSHSDATLQLLIWDMAFSVVIASHSFTLPSTQDMTLTLTVGTSSTALLVLSPLGQMQARSLVFGVPYSVPVASVLLNIVGQQAATTAYLSPESNASADTLSSSQKDIVAAMRSAIARGDHAAAGATFLNEVRGKNKSKLDELMDEVFVREVVDLIWPREKRGRQLLCPEVLRWLFEKNTMRKAFVDGSNPVAEEGGMVKMLTEQGQLDLLLKAIESVPDLTELDIVLFLCAVLPTSRPDVMDVDVSSGPTLEQALASCVRAPWSNGPLRLAIHQCMKDPEGVVKILEVIASWIEGCAVGFIEEDTDVPPLDQIISFLKSLLDATYLTLLSYPPSHSLLRKLAQVTQSKVDVVSEGETLRGPLEPFARRMREGDKRGKEKVGKKKREKREVEWMVGAYRMEELVL